MSLDPDPGGQNNADYYYICPCRHVGTHRSHIISKKVIKNEQKGFNNSTFTQGEIWKLTKNSSETKMNLFLQLFQNILFNKNYKWGGFPS